MEWRCVVWILIIASCIWTGSSKRRSKCSKLISKIPVHKDFDIDKFLGTWYTVSSTKLVWGENTFESSSIVLARNADDSLSYSLTGQSGDKCSAVETGVLEPKRRPGDFTMKGPLSPDPRMIVSFTDYKDVALVYFCFRYRGNKNTMCKNDGAHVEVLAKSETPEKKDVTAYVKRGGKRLCVNEKDMHATTPGLCKVPEIMEAARKETIKGDNSETTDTSSSNCIVDDIPVQQDVDLSMLNGVWYEIARTRFTFNKMESVVANMYYHEKSGRMYSFYTGTMSSTTESDDPCVTPLKGMSKPKHPKGEPAYRLGKIGGDDSAYPWAAIKILFINDNYTMFYACYTGQTDEPCELQGSEISIVGRTRDLDEDTRDAMFALLPSACVNSSDVFVTNFEANCSSHVAEVSPMPGKRPSDCKLHDIEVYDDYSKEELRGVWYLYAYIHFNSSAALSGVVMQTFVAKDQPVEPAESVVWSFSRSTKDGEQTCTNYTSRQRERCLDTADRITTLPYLNGINFVFTKVLHLSDHLLVEYMCTKQTTDRRCEEDGILFNVYMRTNLTMDAVIDDDKDLELISKLADSVYLDPGLLEFETEWCSSELTEEVNRKPAELHNCDVDSLFIYSDIDYFNQEDMYGYWHLIAHSNNTRDMENLESMVAFFISDSNDTLTIYYTGRYNESMSAEVGTAHLLARCTKETNGDYLLRYETTDDVVLYAPFKVLALNTESVLVTYTCQHVLPSGRCNESEAQVWVWGREPMLDDDTMEAATDMMYWACVDPFQEGYLVDMSPIPNDESDIILAEYISANNIIDTDHESDANEDSDENSDEDDDDSDSADEKQQKDQSPDEELSDLEAELLMDDNEFYYGS